MTDSPLKQRDSVPCDDVDQRGDGAQSWVGLTIVVIFALGTALLLGWAAWRWL